MLFGAIAVGTAPLARADDGDRRPSFRSDERRDDRQERREVRTESRQDRRDARSEARQDTRQDRREVRTDVRGPARRSSDLRTERRDNRIEFRQTAPPSITTTRVAGDPGLLHGHRMINYRNTRYYFDNGVWYRPFGASFVGDRTADRYLRAGSAARLHHHADR